MAWLATIPFQVAAAVMLILPGLIMTLAARFRPAVAVLAAPAVTIGVVVGASTLAPPLHVPWSYATVLGFAVILAAVAWLLFRSLLGRVRPGGASRTGVGRSDALRGLATTAIVLAGAALVAWRCMAAFGDPENISQTYDNVFHLNVLRYILDTGQASSLTIGGMTNQPYYPAGWHATVSAVGFALGLNIPSAVNIVNIAISAVVWPFGCVWLARSVFGSRLWPSVIALVVASSLGAFPLLMMDFGVLYPNLLAVATLPSAVAATVLLEREIRRSGMRSTAVLRYALTTIVIVVGTAGAHPTTFMAWLVFAACIWAPTVWRRARRIVSQKSALGTNQDPPRGTAAIRLGGEVTLVAVVFIVLWWKVRPPADADFWGPYTTPPRAVGELVLLSPMGLAAAWLVGTLVVMGLIAALRKQVPAWSLLAFGAFAVIYVVVAGFGVGRLRSAISGVWYNDSYRVAALLPCVGLILAIAGGIEAGRLLRAWLTVGPPSWVRRRYAALQAGPPRLRAVGGAVVVVLLFAAAQQGGILQETQNAHRNYEVTPNAPLLSGDERSLLERLGTDVPPGVAIIGNPFTGTALSYAFADRKNPQLHVIADVSPDLQEVYDHLNHIAIDPGLCASLARLGAGYVLDFGTLEVHGENHTGRGMTSLASAPGLTLVDHQGAASLYEITACR